MGLLKGPNTKQSTRVLLASTDHILSSPKYKMNLILSGTCLVSQLQQKLYQIIAIKYDTSSSWLIISIHYALITASRTIKPLLPETKSKSWDPFLVDSGESAWPWLLLWLDLKRRMHTNANFLSIHKLIKIQPFYCCLRRKSVLLSCWAFVLSAYTKHASLNMLRLNMLRL